MQIKKTILKAVVGVIMSLPMAALAQKSSINTFSPYTLYGIGDLKTPGTAKLRSMGGAGVAFRDNRTNPYDVTMNSLNPASYSAIPRKSFIFNFELEGENNYLKDNNTKTSHNSFNVRDVSIAFPLAKKLGFGFMVTPYSSVGYKMEEEFDDPEIIGTIGHMVRRYEGEGDITQLKVGLGYELFKNFSIGAEMLYYLGSIDRMLQIDINSYVGESDFYNTYRSKTMDFSRISFGAGFQYDVLSTPKNVLTIGGTYRMGTKLKPKMSDYISSGEFYADTTYFSKGIGDISLADVYTFGVFYHRTKFSVGADYSFANWGSENKGLGQSGMKYVNTNSIKGGLQYTPNRFDVRRYFNRLTYRVGLRYDESYMSFNGKKINDKAVTIGLGIPMKLGSPSNINVGLEFGQKGTKQAGLVKANYFKISVGLSLFGEDYWFMKQKYN